MFLEGGGRMVKGKIRIGWNLCGFGWLGGLIDVGMEENELGYWLLCVGCGRCFLLKWNGGKWNRKCWVRINRNGNGVRYLMICCWVLGCWMILCRCGRMWWVGDWNWLVVEGGGVGVGRLGGLGGNVGDKVCKYCLKLWICCLLVRVSCSVMGGLWCRFGGELMWVYGCRKVWDNGVGLCDSVVIVSFGLYSCCWILELIRK